LLLYPSLSSIGFNDRPGALNTRLKVWCIAHYTTSDEDNVLLLDVND
jgi:hypothetical protein